MIVNKYKLQIISIILITLNFACANDYKTNLIVPGKRVSSFEIGKKLNPNIEDIEGLVFQLNQKDSIIERIDVIDERFYMKKGLRVGSDLNLVKKKMGEPNNEHVLIKNPKLDQKSISEKTLRYTNIIFFIDTDNQKVEKIRIW